MPQLRVEICLSDMHHAPEIAIGATIPIDGLTTPAGAQPRAPDGDLATPYFVRAEALQAPAYVAVGRAPDPTREPRMLVMPGGSIDGRSTMRVRPGESVAAILAEDIEWPC